MKKDDGFTDVVCESCRQRLHRREVIKLVNGLPYHQWHQPTHRVVGQQEQQLQRPSGLGIVHANVIVKGACKAGAD